MEAQSKTIVRFNERPPLQFRPLLLMLIPFLATIPCSPQFRHIAGGLAVEESAFAVFPQALLGTMALASLALIVWSKRNGMRSDVPRTPSLICATSYALSVIVLLILLPTKGVTGMVFGILGCVMGVSVPPVIVAWVRLYSLDLRNTMFYGAIACLASSAITQTIALMSPLSTVVCTSVLAVLGTFAPFIGDGEKSDVAADEAAGGPGKAAGSASGDRACDTASGDRTCNTAVGDTVQPDDTESLHNATRDVASILWLPLLGLLVYVFVTNLYSFTYEGQIVRTEFIGSILGAAVALAVCIFRFKAPLVVLIDKIVIPVSLGILVVLDAFPMDSIVHIVAINVVFMPMLFLAIYGIAGLVTMIRGNGYPASILVGIGLLAVSLVAFASFSICLALGGVLDLGAMSNILIAVFFMVEIINLGFTSWNRIMASDEHDPLMDLGATDKEALVVSVLDQRLERVAVESGLTERELRVLEGLSRGYTSNYIAKELLISASTVRTHTRNIYSKLGVHSKSELMDMLHRQG